MQILAADTIKTVEFLMQNLIEMQFKYCIVIALIVEFMDVSAKNLGFNDFFHHCVCLARVKFHTISSK